jgi:CBS domain-containing protein/Zn-dependent protease
LPLGRIGGASLLLDPGLILGLVYFAYAQRERYGDSSLPAGSWAALVALALGVLAIAVAALQATIVVAAGGRLRAVVLTLFGGRARVLAPGRHAFVELRAAALAPLLGAFLGACALAASVFVSPVHEDLKLALYDLGRWQVLLSAAQALPALPFDGGRVVRALLARRMGLLGATRVASWLGRLLALGCLAAACFTGNLTMLFVALFLFAAAEPERDDDAIASALAGQRARDAALRPTDLLSVHDMCGDAAVRLARSDGSALPVLATDGALLAAVATEDLRGVPAARRWLTPIGEMLPRLGGVVSADAPLHAVRVRMLRRGARAVAVVDEGGELCGVVTRARIDRRVEIGELVADERALWRVEPAPPAQETEGAPAPH